MNVTNKDYSFNTMKFIQEPSGNTIVVVPKNDKVVIYPSAMDYVISESFTTQVGDYFEAPIQLMNEIDSIENPTYAKIKEHLTILKTKI